MSNLTEDDERLIPHVRQALFSAIAEDGQGLDEAVGNLWDSGGPKALYLASCAWAHFFAEVAGLNEAAKEHPEGAFGFTVAVEHGAGPQDGAIEVVADPDDGTVPAGQVAAMRFVVAFANGDHATDLTIFAEACSTSDGAFDFISFLLLIVGDAGRQALSRGAFPVYGYDDEEQERDEA